MSSWNQPQQQNNMTMGQAQFNPYVGMQFQQGGNYRLPVYKAEPIHGANAAWQVPMGANSELYLPDADQDIIWWIRTDSYGNKQVQGFDVLPHKEPTPANMDDILARLGAVEEWINAKQNKSNAKRNAGTVPAPAISTTSATTTTEPIN